MLLKRVMKQLPLYLSILTALAVTAHAGTGAAGKMATPMTEIDPFGQITIGGKFSEDLSTGYADIITGLYRTQDSALFINLRGTFGDDNAELFSAGLGFRHHLSDAGLIIGANVYYDQIESSAGNTFQQLGLGAEVLSKWVDARFNYYIPESGKKITGSFVRTANQRTVGQPFVNGNLIQQNVVNRNIVNRFNTVEEARKGWNAEIGVLVPWVEQFCELRIFAGGYSYDNPLGGEFSGFKGRAEARITQGITLDAEYWDDEQLVAGHWVGGVRVSVPFDFSDLCSGRNPFSGNVFAPIKGTTLGGRMDEMVIRSHRVYTASGAPQPAGTTVREKTTPVTTGVKAPAPAPVAPPTDGGGNEEPPEG